MYAPRGTLIVKPKVAIRPGFNVIVADPLELTVTLLPNTYVSFGVMVVGETV